MTETTRKIEMETRKRAREMVKEGDKFDVDTYKISEEENESYCVYERERENERKTEGEKQGGREREKERERERERRRVKERERSKELVHRGPTYNLT